MAETFKLPCSSYEELIKLFQAYANTKEGTALSLDEITQATGVPRCKQEQWFYGTSGFDHGGQ